MKSKMLLLTIFAVVIFLPAHGQEPQLSEEYPLTLTVIGTTNYSDVHFLTTNLKRSTQIGGLSPTFLSRGVAEFSGSYHGSTELLIDEIKGLAQDRFALEIPRQKGGANALSVTLRKLP